MDDKTFFQKFSFKDFMTRIILNANIPCVDSLTHPPLFPLLPQGLYHNNAFKFEWKCLRNICQEFT